MKKLLLSSFVLFHLFYYKLDAQCWKSITAGNYNIAAIRDDGTIWNRLEGRFEQISNDHDWKTISAGYSSIMALKNNGTLWKYDIYNNRWEFTQLGSDTNWQEVSHGRVHVVGLKKNGTIWVWGYNGNNNFGFNTGNDVIQFFDEPILLNTDSDWKSISAGEKLSGAIKTNGTLWIQRPTYAYSAAFEQIGTDTNWTAVELGVYYTSSFRCILGLKKDGTLWNVYNTNESFGQKYTPVQIGTDTTWARISSGQFHSAAIKEDGSYWVWGVKQADKGQFGDTLINDHSQLTRVGNDNDWALAAVGDQLSAGIKTDGSMWGWGEGQGKMNYSNTYIPAQIGSCRVTSLDDELEPTTLSLYPNQADRGIYSFSTDINQKEAVLYNQSGQEFKIQISNNTIDINHMNSGIYYLKIKQYKTIKLVKI